MTGGAKRLFLSTHPPPPPSPPPRRTQARWDHTECAAQVNPERAHGNPNRVVRHRRLFFFFSPLPLPTAGYIKLLRIRVIRDYEAVSWSCNFSGTLLLEPHTPLFDSQWNSPDPFAAAEGRGGRPVPTPLPNLHRAGKLMAPRSTEPNRPVIGLSKRNRFSATTLKMRCRIKQEVPRAAGHTPPRAATCLPHHIRKSF